MTRAANAPGFSVARGEQLTKELIYEVMARQSAASQLSKLWADTFLTDAGINSGTSTGYTYRGASNYDVIVNAGGALKESDTNLISFIDLLRSGTNYARGAGTVFQAASSYNIAKVDFNLKRNGSPTGNVRARLYASDASANTGKPTGAALAESAAVDVSTFSTSQGWVSFDLTTPYALVSGTWYCVVLENDGAVTGDAANKVDLYRNNTTGKVMKNGSDVWGNEAERISWRNYDQVNTQAVVKSVTVTMPAAITSALVFVHSSAAVDLVRISTDSGSTWTTVSATDLATNTQEGNIINVPSGTGVILEVTFSGAVELEAWGFAGV